MENDYIKRKTSKIVLLDMLDESACGLGNIWIEKTNNSGRIITDEYFDYIWRLLVSEERERENSFFSNLKAIIYFGFYSITLFNIKLLLNIKTYIVLVICRNLYIISMGHLSYFMPSVNTGTFKAVTIVFAWLYTILPLFICLRSMCRILNPVLVHSRYGTISVIMVSLLGVTINSLAGRDVINIIKVFMKNSTDIESNEFIYIFGYPILILILIGVFMWKNMFTMNFRMGKMEKLVWIDLHFTCILLTLVLGYACIAREVNILLQNQYYLEPIIADF
ncbi:hypothetical protein NEAUS06_0568 [Nematocida ausubeli]|nr:hypothetical protein NEAUS06_0568 [Nematocida ausubeli]